MKIPQVRTLGLIGEDAKLLSDVAHAITRQSYEMGAELCEDHLEMALYVPELKDGLTDSEAIYESTEVMRRMGMDVAVMVGMPQKQLEQQDDLIPNATPLYISPNDFDSANYASEVSRLASEYIALMTNEVRPEKDILLEKVVEGGSLNQVISDKNLHRNGVVAVHGGLAPEAGFDVFSQVSSYGHSTLLASVPSLAGKIIDFSAEQMEQMNNSAKADTYEKRVQRFSKRESEIDSQLHVAPSPLNDMEAVWERLVTSSTGAGCDALMMDCNTAHSSFEALEKYVKSISPQTEVIHILQEAMKSLPVNSKPIMLSTEFTRQAMLAEDAKTLVGRQDISLVHPQKDEANLLDGAIWNKLHAGDMEGAKQDIEGVIGSIASRMNPGEPVNVLLACTDFKLALNDSDCCDKMVDVASVAAEAASDVATKKSVLRRFMSDMPQDRSLAR